jgi:dihydrofolate reductase
VTASTKEVSVRKVIASIFLTLDGVMEAPGGWQLENNLFDEEMGRLIQQQLFAADALLLGRVTYQEFAAAWPSMTDEDGFADRMNAIPKFVASATLDRLEWNATRLEGSAEEAVPKLKQQPGGDLLVMGSGELLNALGRADLVDEYQLWVHPVVVGRGKRLFKDGVDPKLLRLGASRTFGSGVVLLTYQPAGAAAAGSAPG